MHHIVSLQAHWAITEGRKILIAVLALALASQLAIPFYPVPLTLQTMAIMGIALMLPPFQTALAIMSWITLGSVGFPVFAGFSFGPLVILGPRGGYIMGFLLAAPLISFLYHRATSMTMAKVTGLLCALSACILLCGFLFLSILIGDMKQAFFLGVAPFVFVELVKVCIVSLTHTVWKKHRAF